MDEGSEAYKRLPASVDASFIFVSDTYTGESVRRKPGSANVPGLLDSDSSADDFELRSTPTPGE